MTEFLNLGTPLGVFQELRVNPKLESRFKAACLSKFRSNDE